MSTSQSSSNPGSAFVTTKWTRVMDARGDSPEAKAALSELCAAYYAPVFAFIRGSGYDEDAAKDLTQEFFARVLKRESIGHVDPHRGRFRSFLLGAVKHFLADTYDRSRRLKRGGGQNLQSLDSPTGIALQLPDSNINSPDREFDRRWAMTLLDRALGLLESDYKVDGKADHFEALKPWLTGETEGTSQSDAASRLGLNEGAVKVAIHRLRRRFRELIKNEIAQTLSDSSLVEQELQFLLEALSNR